MPTNAKHVQRTWRTLDKNFVYVHNQFVNTQGRQEKNSGKKLRTPFAKKYNNTNIVFLVGILNWEQFLHRKGRKVEWKRTYYIGKCRYFAKICV